MNSKIREWLSRYGPAELISLPATFFPALLVQHQTHDAIAAALAGTWGGNIGYFGSILIRDAWLTRRRYTAEGRAYRLQTFAKNVRALLVEFGVAELFDSLLVRPALMYFLPTVLGSFGWGIVLAKVIADLTFYVPTIISYELSRKRYRNF